MPKGIKGLKGRNVFHLGLWYGRQMRQCEPVGTEMSLEKKGTRYNEGEWGGHLWERSSQGVDIYQGVERFEWSGLIQTTI